MTAKQTVIVNAAGVHARPASNLVNAAKRFQSKITIKNVSRPNTDPANAKSIMMVLTLAIARGMTVEICADGEDETDAVDTLIALVDSGLGE